MKINNENIRLLTAENKTRFKILCIQHVFQHVKIGILTYFKDSEHTILIDCVNYIDQWLKSGNYKDVSELEKFLQEIRPLMDELYTEPDENSRNELVWILVSLLGQMLVIKNSFFAGMVLKLRNLMSDISWILKLDKIPTFGINQEERKWQEKILDYLLKQQDMQSQLGNPDDSLELARDLVHKVKNGEIKKDELGYRSQIHNYLKDVDLEDKEMVIDYLKSHQVYENLKKIIKEEILKSLK